MILLAVVFFISLAVYLFKKNILLSFFVLSLLSYIVLSGNVDYNFAVHFDILWLFYFINNIWPYLNIILLAALIYLFAKKRNAQK